MFCIRYPWLRILFAEKCWRHFENEKAERLILLGDILYHSPRNDLPKNMRPRNHCSLNPIEEQDLCGARKLQAR